MVQASFEARVRRGRRPRAERHRARGVRRGQDAEGRRPVAVPAGATAPTIRARAFGEALRQIAQLIKADVGLEVAFADVGGWDHARQPGRRAGPARARASTTSRAASPRSSRDLGDRMADVVILTMSEFGRAVAENGNRGTDHGHGNAMMVIGGGVRGGKVYGRWPGLAPEQRYEGRDLAVTTDFRNVFAEVVRGHLGLTDTRSRCFPGFNGAAALGFCGVGSAVGLRQRHTRARRDRLITGAPRRRCVSSSTRRRALERNIDRMQAAADARAACGCGRTPRRTSRRQSRACRSTRGAVGICCAKLGEAEVFADAGIDGHPPALSAQPGQRRSRARAARSHAPLVHRRPPRRRARMVGGDDGAPAATVDVLVKVDVGFHRCGIDPDAPGARGDRRASRALPGLRFRGLLSHAGHAYGAASDDETAGDRRARKRDAADGARGARRGARRARSRRSASARRRRALQRRAGRASPSCGPGNYVYFDRTQVALGVGDVGRLRAHRARARRQPPGRDRIILDSGSKTLTNDSARGFARHAGLRRGARRRSTRATPDRVARRSSGCRKSTRPCASTRRDARSRPATSSASSRTTRASCRTWSTGGGRWLSATASVGLRARGRIA